MQIGLGQSLINARLISPERAAALKQQRDLFERSAPLGHGKPPGPPSVAQFGALRRPDLFGVSRVQMTTRLRRLNLNLRASGSQVSRSHANEKEE
jgi:hypothetical protein